MGRGKAKATKNDSAPASSYKRKERLPSKSDSSAQEKVLPFYSDKAGKKFREFSNFFSDAPPFQFTLPAFAQSEGFPQNVQCEFSEKAIMVTKAALMKDKEIFDEIVVAPDPKSCKQLGRGVRNFDQALWDDHLEDIAFEVVKQKFQANKDLRSVLLSTGDKILVEAAPNDCIWGVGMAVNEDGIMDPAKWRGRNILGYALMKARSYLRGDLAASSCAERGDGCAIPELGATPAAPVAIASGENFLRPISDLAAVRACYDQYGVVAVTGVLSPEECQALLADGIEPHLPAGCKMDDPSTYSIADTAINRYGVIGKKALFSSEILAARVHPNVAASYAAVYGREDVFACHDRAAWMRPAALDAKWDTPFSWPGLHVDVSPMGYYAGSRRAVDEFLSAVDYAGGEFAAENNAKHFSMGRTVQGVLNLYDNDVDDGGFQCVPGVFGASFQEWVHQHPGLPLAEVNGKYEVKNFGVDAKLGAHAVRIPCPAGTLILFDATLPHGTKPNTSANSRAILFLRYISADELPAEAWKNRNEALKRILEQVGFQPDLRQARCLYGPENQGNS